MTFLSQGPCRLPILFRAKAAGLAMVWETRAPRPCYPGCALAPLSHGPACHLPCPLSDARDSLLAGPSPHCPLACSGAISYHLSPASPGRCSSHFCVPRLRSATPILLFPAFIFLRFSWHLFSVPYHSVSRSMSSPYLPGDETPGGGGSGGPDFCLSPCQEPHL